MLITAPPCRVIGTVWIGVVLALAPLAARAESVNLIANGGFETGFRGWLGQEGKMAWVSEAGQAHSGSKALRLTAALVNKQWTGRAYLSKRPEIVTGARYVVSAWVKGQGQASVGVYEYAQVNGSVKYRQRVTVPSPVALTGDWQPIRCVYRPADETVASVSVYAQVTGEKGAMLIDDVSLSVVPEPPTTLALGALPAMAAAGTSLQLPLTIQGAGAKPQLAATLRSENAGVLARPTVGNGRIDVALPAGANGCAILSVLEKTSGALVGGYIDVCPLETYQAITEAAGKVKLPAGSHLVFVGDSLTAFYAGHNYVDKVRWCLQSRLGEGIRVSNAGVGGDTITRVKERLERDVLTLSPKPTHVFIFLGHNDSKLKSPEYREAVVTPADFGTQYREVVQSIQAKLGAKVIILSATSSVYEITKASAAKSAQANRAHNLFGKPETLEQFNAIARKVAEDSKAGYVDMYEPFRGHAEKASLFTPDGVHINEAGNRLVAVEILKYLGR